jgi:hypothetical protein
MRYVGVLGVVSLLLTGLSVHAAAQAATSAGPPATSSPSFVIVALSADQERELSSWLAAVEKWQAYDAKWLNRPVHNGWAHIVPREVPPPAPAWLPGRCAMLRDALVLDIEPRTAAGCRLLDDPTVAAAAQVIRPAADPQPKHSTFLTRMHLDGLAATSQTQGRVYGIVGFHMSLVDIGRVQLFGPPGVLLLTVPGELGGRTATVGYTWGLSIRLSDIRLNSRTKNMTLFLNISKVWSGTESAGGNTGGYDIVGLSIAPRRQR